MALEDLHDPHQLVVRGLVQALEVRQAQGVADARDHVLALRVREVVPVHPGVPGRRIPGERHPRPGIGAEVAEDHRADVHRRAQIVRDPLLAPVELGPLGVPGVEHGADRQVHLLARVLRELPPGLLAHDRLVRLHQQREVRRVQLHVGRHALGALGRLEGLLEVLAVDVQHGLAEHLDQPPVGVPGEALVAGHRGQAGDRYVGDADVEHRLHHPRHRELRARAHRDHQQGVLRVAETPAHLRLERRQMLPDLRIQALGHRPGGQIRPARVRGDGEPRRHRQAEVGHLGEVRTLPAEQILEVLVTFGEVVDVLGRLRGGRSSRRHVGLPEVLAYDKGVADPHDRQPC